MNIYTLLRPYNILSNILSYYRGGMFVDINTIWFLSSLEDTIDLDIQEVEKDLEVTKYDRTNATSISDGTSKPSTIHS